MSIVRRAQQWGTFARIWHVYDATWQDPYKSAELIAHYLKGRHKPLFQSNVNAVDVGDSGDHVVVINSKNIALRGDEWQLRVYFHHNTYHSGESWTKAWELHEKDPTMIVQKAVYKALGNNLQRRYIMPRLHVYMDNKIPNDIKGNISNQIKQLRAVPTRLDHISKEEVENFPKLIDLPQSYILR